jgi:predicted transcriptional regulator of viral defense system
MEYGDLVTLTGGLPWFDLQLLIQAFDGPRQSLRVQLSRWIGHGKLIALRRGMYTLPDAYRRVPLVPAALSNALYRPSYISCLWALAFHDMIPEDVIWHTAVSPRVRRRFENRFGIFDYRTIKQEFFFGYKAAEYGGQSILVAEPEKAMLDHWHLTMGEWTADRLDEMRYQNTEQVSAARLRAYCERFGSPRLSRAVDRWLALAARIEKGAERL